MNKVLSLQTLPAQNSIDAAAAASTLSINCSTWSILCKVVTILF